MAKAAGRPRRLKRRRLAGGRRGGGWRGCFWRTRWLRPTRTRTRTHQNMRQQQNETNSDKPWKQQRSIAWQYARSNHCRRTLYTRTHLTTTRWEGPDLLTTFTACPRYTVHYWWLTRDSYAAAPYLCYCLMGGIHRLPHSVDTHLLFAYWCILLTVLNLCLRFRIVCRWLHWYHTDPPLIRGLLIIVTSRGLYSAVSISSHVLYLVTCYSTTCDAAAGDYLTLFISADSTFTTDTAAPLPHYAFAFAIPVLLLTIAILFTLTW